MACQRQILFFCNVNKRRCDDFNNRIYIQRLKVKIHFARLNFRNIKKIINNFRKSGNITLRHRKEFFYIRRQLAGFPAQDDINRIFDGCKRGSEFMRNNRNKIRFDFFKPFKLNICVFNFLIQRGAF